MHAAIEYQTRRASVCAPSEWLTVVRNARVDPRPFEARWMSFAAFLDWKHVEAQTILKTATDQHGKTIRWTKVRKIKVIIVVRFPRIIK